MPGSHRSKAVVSLMALALLEAGATRLGSSAGVVTVSGRRT